MRKTKVDIPFPSFSIDHLSRVHFMGSCFAENLVTHFEKSGFHTSQDPYGVVFNPLSLAKNLKLILEGEIDQNAILKHNDVYLSYNANSTVYGLSKKEISDQILDLSQDYNTKLVAGSTLFVTFGTAIIYDLNNFGIVANCHKQNATLFQKRMASKEEIIQSWKPLLTEMEKRKVNVVFTVSPVRHSKEGIIQNTLSKSILVEVVHELCKDGKAFYFPAFEIVLDELRDYAYFKQDGVHPNDIAISYVWERVKSTFFSSKTNDLISRFDSLIKLFTHRSIHDRSEKTAKFKLDRKDKLTAFQLEHPNINYSCFKSI